MSEKRVEESLRKGANTGQDGEDPHDKVTRINHYCHIDYCHDDYCHNDYCHDD